jgi:hypothetical protein
MLARAGTTRARKRASTSLGVAYKKDGVPLAGNAAPLQVIVSGEKRPARWVRQVVSIEVRLPPGE